MHSAYVLSCSLTFALRNSVRMVHSVERAQGSEPFAEDCYVYVEGV